ncbi:MAG TPA: hypothetical protein DDW52_24595 [Planctomycetaceae bacterium]|nr:hypothetical protein [Planctomycetaceae bacterium]
MSGLAPDEGITQRVEAALANLDDFTSRDRSTSFRSWAECKLDLALLFACYDGAERVAAAFKVPSDYDIFMSKVGGGLTDGYFDFSPPDVVLSNTKYDAEFYADPAFAISADVSPVHGYWLPVGGTDHKYMNYLCCDSSLACYGTIYRGDDDHPHYQDSPYRAHDSFVGLLEWIGKHGQDK